MTDVQLPDEIARQVSSHDYQYWRLDVKVGVAHNGLGLTRHGNSPAMIFRHPLRDVLPSLFVHADRIQNLQMQSKK